MKSPLRFAALAAASVCVALPLARAQTTTIQSHPSNVFVPEPFKVVNGEAMYLERIALPPGAMLHVSLVGRVAGAEYLPLATSVVPARNGITRFQLVLQHSGVPTGPYRLQAWIIADNRAMFVGRDAQTMVTSLDKPAQIRLKLAPKIQPIDGFGDGRPLAATTQMTLQGTVLKLDRRALLPDSRIELEVRDVSLADAPSKLVMGQVIQLEGGQLPRDFKLELDSADLLPRRRYALSARILEAGKLSYITDTLIEVTPENLSKPFELRVVLASPTP